jgi:hypothetical protein
MSEAEIQGLFHPAQAHLGYDTKVCDDDTLVCGHDRTMDNVQKHNIYTNLGYFLRGFSLSSCPQQSESPLAPKSHVSLK